MKSFFYHPRPVGPAEPATSAEAKGEKRAALSIRLEPDSRWEHREPSKEGNKVAGWLKDDGD